MKTCAYLLHVTEADRWPAVLSNLANMVQQGYGPELVVVINGTAIYVLQGEHDWRASMARAAAAGVRFHVCQRSLDNHQISSSSLPEWIVPVPAALPSIAEQVGAGATYIKP
ncbi:DsrE family protein [Buchananella hordeovulneris]|uniref:CoA biosynthesis protein CoaBC n=1 Tax=Buchananella hordeovulneris TaxID=52770 RepID=A0A1Q5PV33_9ACTO|nr:DsrE family protein [Buchananella hordeovulneris]MDO5080460.1 DsrE family protein [Buchananella hordeovulneris]OKL51427.1 CoA biosynthesis protein CoaBC [Buchananella hordeovulneris]RRD44313.1 CoA biosynthesis protein CoaBC [Buchananella hordeovulneris]